MARYTGPTCRLARRERADLGLKSNVRALKEKCNLEQPPGMQTQSRSRLSDYGVQLREKQKLRRIYGVLERQFRRYFREAARRKGSTSSLLLRMLETRLDNVVYRMGFASTRAEARQIVRHRGIIVDDKVVNIPSYEVRPGQTVGIAKRAKEQDRIASALDLSKQRATCAWLEVDVPSLTGVFKAYPEREEFAGDTREQLVVELYSR